MKKLVLLALVSATAVVNAQPENATLDTTVPCLETAAPSRLQQMLSNLGEQASTNLTLLGKNISDFGKNISESEYAQTATGYYTAALESEKGKQAQAFAQDLKANAQEVYANAASGDVKEAYNVFADKFTTSQKATAAVVGLLATYISYKIGKGLWNGAKSFGRALGCCLSKKKTVNEKTATVNEKEKATEAAKAAAATIAEEYSLNY